jgi:GNAT superfamily N-acetyltransferase
MSMCKTVCLENGEKMQISTLRPPAPERFESIWNHQIHMNGNDWYRRIFKQRLEGRYVGECIDTYFIGEINGEIAGLIWYGYPVDGSGVGNWGDVLTAPRHRGKGVMKHLLMAFSHDFRSSSAKALLCGANPKAMNSYERIGWRLIRPTDSGGGPAYLLHPDIAEKDFIAFERDYYIPGRHVSIVRGTMRHRHDIDRMMSFSQFSHTRKQTFDVGRIGPAQAVKDYMQAVFAVEDGRGEIAVAITPEASVVGWAFCLAPDSPLEAETRILDCTVHPNYAVQAVPLLRKAMEWGLNGTPRKVYAWCLADDAEKVEAMRETGLRNLAHLKNHVSIDGCLKDALILEN